MTVSQELAAFIRRTRYEDLPEQAVVTVKRFLIDALGVAIGGAASSLGQKLLAFIHENAGGDEASVVGTRLRAGHIDAAFANGALIRVLEFEETFEDTMLHVAPGTIGASLALIEKARCSGREFMTALALGYEVSQRTSMAVSPELQQKFHASGTTGSFGATAAAACIAKLREEQIVAAFGIAGLQAAGLFQAKDPSWRYLTSVNGGSAARLGVFSALLARHGVPGSVRIFEGADGFSAAHVDQFDASLITRGLGKEFVLCEGGLKLYPSSRFTHAAITASSVLRKRHNVDPKQIREVLISGASMPVTTSDKPSPENEFDAQGSQQFTVAVTLLNGTFSLGDANTSALRDSAVREVMAKIKVMVDPELEAERRDDPKSWPTVVELLMNNGARYREKIDYPLGTAQNPLNNEQLGSKFRAVVRAALPADQADELWDSVEHIEDLADLDGLVRLWQPRA